MQKLTKHIPEHRQHTKHIPAQHNGSQVRLGPASGGTRGACLGAWAGLCKLPTDAKNRPFPLPAGPLLPSALVSCRGPADLPAAFPLAVPPLATPADAPSLPALAVRPSARYTGGSRGGARRGGWTWPAVGSPHSGHWDSPSPQPLLAGPPWWSAPRPSPAARCVRGRAGGRAGGAAADSREIALLRRNGSRSGPFAAGAPRPAWLVGRPQPPVRGG